RFLQSSQRNYFISILRTSYSVLFQVRVRVQVRVLHGFTQSRKDSRKATKKFFYLNTPYSLLRTFSSSGSSSSSNSPWFHAKSQRFSQSSQRNYFMSFPDIG